MKDLTVLLFTISVIVFLHSSTNNPVTQPNSAAMLSVEELTKVAGYKYKQFLRSNKVIQPKSDSLARLVEETGDRLSNAIKAYFSEKGVSEDLEFVKWEFAVVNRKEANLWCMPGGKMIIYEGIFSHIQTESQLALLMAHEMSHELAQHANEMMCKQMEAKGIEVKKCKVSINNPLMHELFMGLYSLDKNQKNIFPYSARQETDADHFSLIFTALAGYNPVESWSVWRNMDTLRGSEKPAYLSFHPSEPGREEEMEIRSEEAKDYFKPAADKSKMVSSVPE